MANGFMNSAACALLLPFSLLLPSAAAAAEDDRLKPSMAKCIEACGLGLMGVDMGLGCGVARLVR